MSIITVVRKGNHAAIAADTLYSLGTTDIPHAYASKRSKLVELPHGWMGLVGSSTHQLVLRSLVRRKPEALDFSSADQIFESLLALQGELTEHYFVRPSESDEHQPYDSNQLDGLICNAHGIFAAASYREVCEYDTFWAMGSGRDVALGALHVAYETLDDAAAIARAGVLAACEFDEDCGAPVHVKVVELESPAGTTR